jgi:hypothetical protein
MGGANSRTGDPSFSGIRHGERESTPGSRPQCRRGPHCFGRGKAGGHPRRQRANGLSQPGRPDLSGVGRSIDIGPSGVGSHGTLPKPSGMLPTNARSSPKGNVTVTIRLRRSNCWTNSRNFTECTSPIVTGWNKNSTRFRSNPVCRPFQLLPLIVARRRGTTWAFVARRTKKLAPTQVSRLGCVGA